jgi:hypothetical protein
MDPDPAGIIFGSYLDIFVAIKKNMLANWYPVLLVNH